MTNLLSKNFGGIDAKATRLNINANEAEWISNFDIGIDGAITRRAGCEELADLGTPLCHLGRGVSSAGSEFYIAVADSKIWRSTDLTTWEDVTGSVTLAGTSGYNGICWREKYLIANGTDQPFYVAATGDARYLEAASQLPDVTSGLPLFGTDLDIYNSTRARGGYVVTAITPRGETAMSSVIMEPSISGFYTSYGANYLTWNPVYGAYRYRVYVGSPSGVTRSNGTVAAGSFGLVAELPNNVFEFTDTISGTAAGTATPFILASNGMIVIAPTQNTAYLTPNDWNENGAPCGFQVVARGRDERALAWRGNTVWASGLGDPLNWMTVNDSFVFQINAGQDNAIQAIGAVNSYFIVFTRTDAFVYQGASANSIALQMVVPLGCASQQSIQAVGDDFYFWSQYGPSTMKRVVSGSDVASTTDFNKRIQPICFSQTNVEQWSQICSFNSPQNNRVVWFVPGTAQTENTLGLVYQYDVDAWSSYSGWTPVSVVRNIAGNVYAGFTDGKIYEIQTGTSDNGEPIAATYKTGHYDMGQWSSLKRIPYIDVVMDSGLGPYTVNVSWNIDASRELGDTVYLNNASTNGVSVPIYGPYMAYHRVHTFGLGRTLQLVFTTSTPGQQARILGWETDARPRGKRG